MRADQPRGLQRVARRANRAAERPPGAAIRLVEYLRDSKGTPLGEVGDPHTLLGGPVTAPTRWATSTYYGDLPTRCSSTSSPRSTPTCRPTPSCRPSPTPAAPARTSATAGIRTGTRTSATSSTATPPRSTPPATSPTRPPASNCGRTCSARTLPSRRRRRQAQARQPRLHPAHRAVPRPRLQHHHHPDPAQRCASGRPHRKGRRASGMACSRAAATRSGRGASLRFFFHSPTAMYLSPTTSTGRCETAARRPTRSTSSAARSPKDTGNRTRTRYDQVPRQPLRGVLRRQGRHLRRIRRQLVYVV